MIASEELGLCADDYAGGSRRELRALGDRWLAALSFPDRGRASRTARCTRGKSAPTIEQGAEAYGMPALTGLNLLSVAHAALGDLGRVSRVVKLLGMVNAVPEFRRAPRR